MSTQTPKFKSLTSRECRSVNETRIGLSGSGRGLSIAPMLKAKNDLSSD